MDGYIQVAVTDELADGQMKRVTLDGTSILVARVGERYYATGATCPHMGGDLSRGMLQGPILTCPRHHSQFDVRDGHVVRWTDWSGAKLALGKAFRSPRPLTSYAVRVDDGAIQVAPQAADRREAA